MPARRARMGERSGLDAAADAFGQRQRLVMIERAGHHHELFAAYPRGELASALSVAVQDRCDLLQTEVAGRMAEQIVVFLEVIHIDHQQAQLRALPASTKQLLLERAIKIAPVEEAG